MSDRLALRIGAFGAIVGGVFGLVGNILHPREARSLEVEGFLAEVSESGIWVADHLLILVGIALLLPALYGLTRSIGSDGAREWAQFAWAAGIVGVVLGLVLIVNDALAVPAVAKAWAAAPDQSVALAGARGIVAFNFAMFTALMLITFGAVPVLYGVAMLRGHEYAAWLGWVGVIFGLLSVVAGVIQAFTGLIALTAFVLFPIASIVITLWFIYLGVLMNRKASAAAADPV